MEGSIRTRRNRRHTVRIVIVGIIALVTILVGWYALQALLEQRRATEHAAAVNRSEQRVEAIITQFSQPLAAAVAQLDQLAASAEIKKLLRTAAASPEPQALLTAAAVHYADTIDYLLKLRLLLPDAIRHDPDAKDPISFASLAMLEAARAGHEPIAAEVHMPGTEQAHIVVVRSVRSAEDGLIGLLHATLSVQLLEQTLAGIDAGEGYLEVKQYIPGATPVVVLAQGDSALKKNPISQSRPIPASAWTLSYWPLLGQSGAPGSGWLLWIVLAALFIGVALVIGWRWLQRSGSGQEGSTSYAGAVQAFIDGAHPALGKLIPDLPRGRAAGKMLSSPPPPGGSHPKHEDNLPEVSPAPPEAVEIPAGIFRAYDIRGLVETELTPRVVEQLGRAIGSEAHARGLQGVVVGRDGRLSSPKLAGALIQGLRASGVDVIDIGLVATPVLYFATHHLAANSGVMITGSHNGPEYNGLKMVLGGETLSGDTVKALYQRIRKQDFSSGSGSLQTADITADYVRRATEDIPVALDNAFKIVVDGGNGAASKIAPQVYRALGHEILELYCDIDGNFPNHHPDPSQPENLQDLITMVKETGADLGLAFDGDGDRLGVVDTDGNIIWPDRQLMLLARDVLSRNPGAPIIFDVKCSRDLKEIIQSAGGKPLMWKTGHSLIKAKMKEVKAPLAGEMSGHIFFKERWYGFDDAIYTGARLLEILVARKEKPTAVLAELPDSISTPELRVRLPESRHAEVMRSLQAELAGENGELIDVDGLRIDYHDGWGLIRPSNTSPFLVARFEAESEQALARIQATFRNAVQAVDPALQTPF